MSNEDDADPDPVNLHWSWGEGGRTVVLMVRPG